MWWVILPLLAGAWLGKESPELVWGILGACCLVILVGLGDPALAVVILGFIIVGAIGLAILYNIVPILLFLLGGFIALAFGIVVLMGIVKLLGG